MTTRAPAAASPLAMPSPIPPLPPVTTATLPFSSTMLAPLTCKGYVQAAPELHRAQPPSGTERRNGYAEAPRISEGLGGTRG